MRYSSETSMKFGRNSTTEKSGHISLLEFYRLVCALVHQSLVAVLTRCGLPLPTYFLADGKYSHCLADKVYAN